MTRRMWGALATVVTLALAWPVAAADEELVGLEHTTPEQRADYQTELMTQILALSPAEAERVRSLNLTYAKLMDPILKGEQSSVQRMIEGRKVLGAKDAAMKDALTPDQYQLYMKTKKQVRAALEKKFAVPAQPSTPPDAAPPPETSAAKDAPSPTP